MKAFAFERPADLAAAASAAAEEGAALKAGGTDLLDRMKERIDEPRLVVWLGALPEAPLREIVRADDGGLRIGALATLAEVAESGEVASALPALAEAAGGAASPQLRRRATVGGNLAQHTRCGYYRHESFPCLRRGDEVCPVLREGGVQDTAAIFGNALCASAHPSSLAPVLAAAGAVVLVRRGEEDLELRLGDLYAPPERGRRGDTVLRPGDVLTGVAVPLAGARERTAYVELRQKAAFDWALASAAARVALGPEGTVAAASIWLGAVAPTPHRAPAAEQALRGRKPDEAAARDAALAAVADATPLAGNAHKVRLAEVAVRRALLRAFGRA